MPIYHRRKRKSIKNIRVHCNDILKTSFARRPKSKFERPRYLAFIHSIEQMAIMDQKPRPHSSLRANLHQRHVQTKNLHVSNPSASITFNRNLELRPPFRSRDFEPAVSIIVELRDEFCYYKNRLFQYKPSFLVILLKTSMKIASVDFQLRLLSFQKLCGLEALFQCSSGCLQLTQPALKSNKIVQRTVTLEYFQHRVPLVVQTFRFGGNLVKSILHIEYLLAEMDPSILDHRFIEGHYFRETS